jgi:pimeloyl-ACP methyl ester carboxylesterase
MEIFYLQRDYYRLLCKRINRFPVDETRPTLVFLHDLWGCVEMWGDLPEALVGISGLNALVFDRRGYG